MVTGYRPAIIDVWYGNTILGRAKSPKVVTDEYGDDYDGLPRLWEHLKNSKFLQPERVASYLGSRGVTVIDPAKYRVVIKQGHGGEGWSDFRDVTDEHQHLLQELVTLLPPKNGVTHVGRG